MHVRLLSYLGGFQLLVVKGMEANYLCKCEGKRKFMYKLVMLSFDGFASNCSARATWLMHCNFKDVAV